MNQVLADPLKLAHSIASSASQLRLGLLGTLELPCLAHAKTEDLARVRALIEMCASKASEVEETADALFDQSRLLGTRAA